MWLVFLLVTLGEVALWRDLLHRTFHEPFDPWLLLTWPLAVYVTCLGLAVCWSAFWDRAPRKQR